MGNLCTCRISPAIYLSTICTSTCLGHLANIKRNDVYIEKMGGKQREKWLHSQ